MDDSAKYLIRATITADGIVERSDVVGAVFGQTEGLLGDDLDLRSLQQSSKVGRIDVEVESEGGRSFGDITIATSLDRIETAVLAAALETISRVGPCQARIEVTDVQDVRAAKRRIVVERAKELLADAFDDTVMSTDELLAAVREAAGPEEVTDYEELPAGPNVDDSDAVVVVEGRADVVQLLGHGIKNAVAVEGTDVPDSVAALTRGRTTTAFLDGDRGGELILRELGQVGDIDYVAFAPEDRSVEDLSREEAMAALRNKVAFAEYFGDEDDADGRTEAGADGGAASAATDGSGVDASDPDPASAGAPTGPSPDEGRPLGSTDDADESEADGQADGQADSEAGGNDETAENAASDETAESAASDETAESAASDETAENAASDETAESAASDEATEDAAGDEATEDAAGEEATEDAAGEEAADGAQGPRSLRDHVAAVIDEGTGCVRLLDADLGVLTERPAEDAFDAVEGADSVPEAVVLDGEFTQRLLDVAAQRGVNHVVAATTGEFVKRPVAVRVRTADQLRANARA